MGHSWDTKNILKATLPIAVLGGLLILYHSFNPSQHSFFLPCPLKYTTDLYCAGCGSQRAIHHLMHFEFFQAFRYNPLLVLTIPLLIYALVIEYLNFAFGTKHRVKLFYSNKFIVIYFGIAIIYAVLRNIPTEPFSYLAPLN